MAIQRIEGYGTTGQAGQANMGRETHLSCMGVKERMEKSCFLCIVYVDAADMGRTCMRFICWKCF